MNKATSPIYKFVFIGFILSSCAGAYHPIMPGILSYNAHNNIDQIDFSYKYGVMLERQNKKYAKKEIKKGVSLVAVQIKNNTNKPIVVKDDISFYTNNQRVYPLEPLALKSMLKQQGGYYLFYLLFTPMTFTTFDSNGNVQSSFPYGLILGPALAFGNLIGASTANKTMVNEYSKEYIFTKTIEPGEKISGLMAIKTFEYPEITVRYDK